MKRKRVGSGFLIERDREAERERENGQRRDLTRRQRTGNSVLFFLSFFLFYSDDRERRKRREMQMQRKRNRGEKTW